MRSETPHEWSRRARLALGALTVVLLSLLITLPGAHDTPLTDPDEGRQAEVGREVFEARSLAGRVVPHLDGKPYHHKPILFYWLVGAAYAVHGVQEASARAVPIAASAAIVVLVFLWAAAAIDPASAFWAAVVLATSVEFAVQSRFVNLDATLTLWITAGAFALERWSADAGRARWLIAAALAAALGFLTKGLVAPFFIGCVGVVAFVLRRPPLRLRSLTAAALVTAAGVLPWVVTAARADPAYLPEFLLKHHFARYASASAPHDRPFWFYVPVLLGGGFPWILLLPAALWRGRRTHMPAALVVCAVWTTVVVAFFSLSHGKLPSYVLPALPPLAVVLGHYLAALRATGTTSTVERRAVLGALWIAAVTLCLLPLLLLVSGSWIFEGALRPAILPSLLLVPFGIALGTLAAQGRVRAIPVVLAAGMVLSLAAYHGLSSPRLSAVASTEQLSHRVQRAGALSDTAVVTYKVRAPSLSFYLRRPVDVVDWPKRLTRLAAAHEQLLVVTNARHAADVIGAGVDYLWADTGRWRLYGTRPPPA